MSQIPTQQIEQIKIQDHNGNPIERNTFYARDSLCYPQWRTSEEKLIADSRTTQNTLYRVIYADDSKIDLVYFGELGEIYGIELNIFTGEEESREISLEGEEAAQLASRLRPISIDTVKRIADEHKAKARSLDDALFDTLKRANSSGQKTL